MINVQLTEFQLKILDYLLTTTDYSHFPFSDEEVRSFQILKDKVKKGLRRVSEVEVYIDSRDGVEL